MKIYVASKFEERLKVRWLMDRLEDLGHEITFDWTAEYYKDRDATKDDMIECVDGVLDADVYVGLFVENHTYKGALVELGIALTSELKVYIIGHAIDSCDFMRLVDQRFESETEFLSFIRRLG